MEKLLIELIVSNNGQIDDLKDILNVHDCLQLKKRLNNELNVIYIADYINI